jgi:hypothetical protein
MDKIWLYLAGMVVGAAVIIYFVLSSVSSMNPPAY